VTSRFQRGSSGIPAIQEWFQWHSSLPGHREKKAFTMSRKDPRRAMNFKKEIISRYLQRLTMLVSAGAFVVGASLTMGGGAAQASQPNSDWNEIVAKFDNAASNTMCFDAPDNFTVQLWHCHGSGSTGVLQRWHFTFIPGESQAEGVPVYTIENLQTGRCLINAGTNSGTALTQAFCTSAFLEVDLGVGTNPLLHIRALGTNLCLEPVNPSDSNGTRLMFSTCNIDNDIQQTLSFLQ
jgi:hypothetical protein